VMLWCLLEHCQCFAESWSFHFQDRKEDRGSIFLQNGGNTLHDYTVPHPRRQQSSIIIWYNSKSGNKAHIVRPFTVESRSVKCFGIKIRNYENNCEHFILFHWLQCRSFLVTPSTKTATGFTVHPQSDYSPLKSPEYKAKIRTFRNVAILYLGALSKVGDWQGIWQEDPLTAHISCINYFLRNPQCVGAASAHTGQPCHCTHNYRHF
jgi:hypothetical protein